MGRLSSRVLTASAVAVLVAGSINVSAAAAGNGNANLHPDKTVTAVGVEPQLALTLAVDKDDAIPGDRLVYTATVSNSGASLVLAGDLVTANNSAATATIASYWDAVSTTNKAHCGADLSDQGKDEAQWTAFGGAAAAQAGYTPVDAAPIETGMVLEATPVPADGVTYPAADAEDQILGTRLAPGATATWHYEATLALTPAQLDFLRDSDLVSRIRNSFHAEPTPRLQNGNGQPARVNIDFCEAFAAADTTGTARGVEVTVVLPDGSAVSVDSSDVAGLAAIAIGHSTTVQVGYTVPALPVRGGSESEAAYLARLLERDGAVLAATAGARIDLTGPALVSAGPVSTAEHLPILSVAKTGPETADAGTATTYDIALANAGSAHGTALTVLDTLPAGIEVPVTDVPASLAPGASATAHATYEVPVTQPAGDLTDTVALTWKDANGNPYGPLTANATTDIVPVNLVSHLTLTPEVAGPMVVGSSHSLTVTATDAQDQPVADVQLRLKLVGANATTVDLITDAQGQAVFTYTGAASGTDSAQAVALEIPGLASNTATALWVVPVIPVTTTLVHARFFPSAAVNTDDFTATPDMTPLWEQDFPNISFDPVSGKVKNDKSGVNTGTRPFTDVTTDLAGNYTGTIVAAGNGYQAGLGDLVAFDAVFTGTFFIAEAGDYQFDFLADDGFIFGIDGGAVSLPGSVSYRCPASGLTVFEQYAVMGCYQHNTPPIANKVLVHFPAPGTYPYELDYLEVFSGSLSLNMTMHSTGLQVAPMGSISLSPQKPADAQRGIPQTYTASVLGVDGMPVAGLPVTLNVSGANSTSLTAITDAAGLATFTYSAAAAGEDDLEAFAYIGEYLIISNVVRQNWTSAPPVPVMSDVSPADGSVVTQPTPIKASFAPPPGTSIDSWSVAYQAAGATSSVELASGTGAPPETLAIFDPTVLTNGPYTISVNVVTSGGTSQTNNISIVVDGNLKLGRYQVTYQDADIPVGGIPIQVLRTYDSFDKTKGDFGIGWRMSIANFRVYSNGPLGTGGWAQYPKSCFAAGLGGGLCIMGWTAARPHYVTVVWPDGHQEVFDFTPTDSSNLFWQSSAAFTARPGSTSKLEAMGTTTISYFGNGNLYAGMSQNSIYNPTQFRLTAKDGTVYELDTSAGLTKAIDRTGNTVTVSTTGIKSSLGPAITFSRDSSGRIILLGKPDSTWVGYSYNAAGDLASVRDERSNVVTFEYDSKHNLTKTIDPLGRPFETVTYDDSGRIVSVTDATGNTTQVTSDPGTLQQRVTDPTGRKTTVSSFNEQGDLVRVDVTADGKTATTRYAYDEDHNVTSRTDAAGGVWAATYDAQRNLTSFTDALGKRISLTYNAYGYPVSWSDPNGGVTVYQWNANGTLASVSDALGNDETYEYDSKGNMTARTDREGHRWTYSYDSAGRMASSTNPLGQRTSYTYDAAGRLKSQTDSLNHTTSYTYDAAGNLTLVTDPLSQATAYAYDSLGFLASVTDAAGKTTTYGRDAAGRVTSVTDPLGATTHTAYDAAGRVATTTDAESNTTTYAYDGFGNLASTTDPLGRTTTNAYDLRGLLLSSTNPAGGVTRYIHDADGNVLSITDPNGRVSRTTYGPHGEVLTSTDPAGKVTSYEYDLLGNLRAVTDATGRTTRNTYDKTGNLTYVTDPAGALTSYGYDAAGRLTSVTDPLGHTTSYGYDAAGRQVRITDALGHNTVYAYDNADRLTSVTSAAGVKTTYEHDARGLTTKVTDTMGHSTVYAYDNAGRLASETDPRGYTTTYEYDARGLQTSITDALGHSVGFGYDAAGRQTSLTDANGQVWATAYDALGNVSSTTDPLGHVTSYTHDSAGQLTSRTDARGITTSYEYDTAGRLALISAPHASIATTYDAAGRRTSMTDSIGTTTYGYDTAGRLASVASPLGAVSYTYDAAGNRSTMTVGPRTVGYGYDAGNRLTTVSQAGLGTFTFGYDFDGRLTNLERPNGLSSATTYDAAGRLSTLTYEAGGTILARYAYVLDAAGNRTGMGGTGGTESYVLDAAGRLTSVAYSDGTTIGFTYDAAGNRTSMTSGGSTTTYTYDAASQLTSAGAISYAYDPAGNRIAAGSASFGYDDFGNLASATAGASAVTYTSNGDGLRVSATSGGSSASYLWDQAAGLPSLLSDGTTGFLSADATLLAETSASGSAYPITDALGSVRALTDSSGSLSATAAYDVFGSVRSSSGSVGSLGYTAALSDSSGLVYLQARSLDPASGTFTSRDPLTPGGPGITGFNPYAYAGQNPTTYSDPSGRNTLEAALTRTIGAVSRPAVALVGDALVSEILWSALSLLLVWELTQAMPRTLPWPGTHPEVPDVPWDKVGRSIRDLPWTIAKTITALCVGAILGSSLASAFLGKGSPFDICNGSFGPVFMPGADTADSTAHDLAALASHPFWVNVTRIQPIFPKRWYTREKYGNPCKLAREDWGMPTGGDCDEFPFRTTAEGGPGLPYWMYPAQPTKVGADIMPIDSIDNETQGGILSYFYSACRVTPRSRFFVVPIPFLPKTMWNGNGCG